MNNILLKVDVLLKGLNDAQLEPDLEGIVTDLGVSAVFRVSGGSIVQHFMTIGVLIPAFTSRLHCYSSSAFDWISADSLPSHRRVQPQLGSRRRELQPPRIPALFPTRFPSPISDNHIYLCKRSRAEPEFRRIKALLLPRSCPRWNL